MMQFQSDVFGFDVVRPKVLETTALGAAYLAGLAVGFWNSIDDLQSQWSVDQRFSSSKSSEEVQGQIQQWHKAVSRVKDWARD
jgi:glycerol kinase